MSQLGENRQCLGGVCSQQSAIVTFDRVVVSDRKADLNYRSMYIETCYRLPLQVFVYRRQGFPHTAVVRSAIGDDQHDTQGLLRDAESGP